VNVAMDVLSSETRSGKGGDWAGCSSTSPPTGMVQPTSYPAARRRPAIILALLIARSPGDEANMSDNGVMRTKTTSRYDDSVEKQLLIRLSRVRVPIETVYPGNGESMRYYNVQLLTAYLSATFDIERTPCSCNERSNGGKICCS
jgi:hypothetical protein